MNEPSLPPAPELPSPAVPSPSAGSAPATAPPKKRTPLGLVLAGLAVLAGKAKFLLAGLKFLPLGKLLLTSLTMVTSIWLYAQIYGLKFAAGFVILILLHELGHGVAMKSVGVEAGWPIFIPFFGASISLKSMPRSAYDHAVIAYGGPLAGAAASLVCAAIALVTREQYWLALANAGFFLNLFNLIPMEPLDGGRIASGFSRRSWIVGAVLLGGMFLVTHAPQLLLIAVLALMSGARRSSAAMAPMSDEEKWRWTVRYFGLCFALGAALYFSHRLLEPSVS
jgi:Zn-dependent protease